MKVSCVVLALAVHMICRLGENDGTVLPRALAVRKGVYDTHLGDVRTLGHNIALGNREASFACPHLDAVVGDPQPNRKSEGQAGAARGRGTPDQPRAALDAASWRPTTRHSAEMVLRHRRRSLTRRRVKRVWNRTAGIGAAAVAIRGQAAGIVAGTSQPLTFSGAPAVKVSPGATMMSNPL